ncbi:MAG: ABC transporter substrate-binding protein [Deltaproteobacteria bacterium]|nr:MAG: ABC transporter substrate-binding protein [Deltaproteobacteria bacterium]
MSKKSLGYSALIFLLACFSHPAWSQESTGLKKIRIGMPNRGVPNLGLPAAQRFGFFRAQGLDAELIVMRPSVSLQTLLAGDLDYSTVLASGARASVSGLPLRIVMALTVGQDFSLVVRPEIRRMEDLKGKTLAVSGVGEFTDVGTRLVLKKYGLVPEVDVKLRALYSNHPLRLSALQAGQIDGTVMSMPYNKMAVKMGFRELVQLREFIKTPQGGLVTTVQKIRSEPDLVLRTIKAALMANRFLRENKGEFTKLLARESGIHDQEVAGLIHEEAVKLFSDTGLVSDGVMQEFIANSKETLKVSREISISEVADFSFARRAISDLKQGR